METNGIYEALRADLRHATTLDAVTRVLSGHFAGAYHACLDEQEERDEAEALDSAREIVSACAGGRWTFSFRDDLLTVEDVEAAEAIEVKTPSFRLGDDGTLDTVIVCDACGAEMRFNYDPVGGATSGQDADNYREFVRWAKNDAAETHVCGEDCPAEDAREGLAAMERAK